MSKAHFLFPARHKELQFPSEEYRPFLIVRQGYQLQGSGHRGNLPLHNLCQKHAAKSL